MKKLFVLMVCVLFAAHAQAQNEKQGLKSLSECEGDAPEGIDVYAGENEEGMAILTIFKKKSLSECEGDAPEGIDVYAGENEEGMAILTIFKNAMPVQTMNVGYVNVNRYGGDISFVHYADVNFDGHTDILIGMDAPRNYITPIIYNPQTAKYDYQGDDITMQQPIFDMDNKQFYFTKFVPAGKGIKAQKMFRITSDPVSFNKNSDPQFRVKFKYEEIDMNEKLIRGFNTYKQIPAEWKRPMEKLGFEDW